jgi:hypothetical protein
MPATGPSVQSTRISNGKIGELLVELELTANGWHVERLDGAAKAANGDLIAIKGTKRIVIQVKSGKAAHLAFLGYAGGFLNENKRFFNANGAPIETDFVVAVGGDYRNARFYVFSVDEAEELAQKEATDRHQKPKKNGETRSPHFPVGLRMQDYPGFENAWHKLDERQPIINAALEIMNRVGDEPPRAGDERV